LSGRPGRHDFTAPGTTTAPALQIEDEDEDKPYLPFAGRAGRRVLHKAAGTIAHELMTTPPLTIGAHQDVGAAARMVVDRHIKRLIVTDARASRWKAAWCACAAACRPGDRPN